MSFPPDAPDQVELRPTKVSSSSVDGSGHQGAAAGDVRHSNPETCRVCLTIETKKGRFYLYLFPIDRQQMDGNTMAELRAKWLAVLRESEPFIHHLRLVLLKPVIEVGTISAVSPSCLWNRTKLMSLDSRFEKAILKQIIARSRSLSRQPSSRPSARLLGIDPLSSVALGHSPKNILN